MRSDLGLPTWIIVFAIAYTIAGILSTVVGVIRADWTAVEGETPLGLAIGITTVWSIQSYFRRKKMKATYGDDWESMIEEDEMYR